MSTYKTTRDSGIVEDFVPPPGPPPPIMPEGWIAKFDDRYQQFFYVNLSTKWSQWDKPPGAIDASNSRPVTSEGDRPPSYIDTKSTSPRPAWGYDQHEEPSTIQTAHPITPSQDPQSQYPNAPQSNTRQKSPGRGIAGRLSSFLKSHSPKPPPNHQQQQYYSPQQGYYQQQGRPVYVQGSMPGYVQGPPRRAGMGVGGAAALGAGGGLLGGLLLADAFDDHDGYQQGFDNGADFGGDYGGGDMGGGDFGGF